VLNTVVPILCVCGPGCINLANILPVCNYCAKMQKKNLVPEILYVRAFKFAVSRDFYIAVQLNFYTIHVHLYSGES
jgi:hypothetical protein